MSSFLLSLKLPPWLVEVVTCPTFWGILCAVIGLFLLLPPNTRRKQVLGGIAAVIGLVLIIADMVALQWPIASPAPHVVFWLLASIAIAGGVGLISAQSPIYSAMWFALSLLGVAALFLQQDAQFLGIATMIVYAGAIVVTFLFVLMLAQPEGHSTVDRISWGVVPKVLGVVVAGALVGLVAQVLHSPQPPSVRDQLAATFPELAKDLASVEVENSNQGNTVSLYFREKIDDKVPDADIVATLKDVAPDATLKRQVAKSDVQAKKHMAHLGGYLFSRHLIAIELAGTLLLAALVGAVGMVIQGRLAKEGAAHE